MLGAVGVGAQRWGGGSGVSNLEPVFPKSAFRVVEVLKALLHGLTAQGFRSKR